MATGMRAMYVVMMIGVSLGNAAERSRVEAHEHTAVLQAGDGEDCRAACKQAIELCHRLQVIAPDAPIVPVINKADLFSQWRIHDDYRSELRQLAGELMHASAKTGQGVEEIFGELARRMLPGTGG